MKKRIDPEKLKTRRKQKQWSQQHLANLVGASQSNIQKLESGQPKSTHYLDALAGALECNSQDLLTAASQAFTEQLPNQDLDPYKLVGQRIDHCCMTLGLSDAAIAAQLDTTPGKIHLWRRSNILPKNNHLKQLAQLFLCDSNWLLSGVGRASPYAHDATFDIQTHQACLNIHILNEDTIKAMLAQNTQQRQPTLFGFKTNSISSEPLLKQDSLAIIQSTPTFTKYPALYMLIIDGYIIIRQILMEAGKYYAKVVNTHLNEPIRKLEDGSYQIVGEVIGDLSHF